MSTDRTGPRGSRGAGRLDIRLVPVGNLGFDHSRWRFGQAPLVATVAANLPRGSPAGTWSRSVS